MKHTYLISTLPNAFKAVIASLKQKNISIEDEMELISTLVVTSTHVEAESIKKIKGVLSVEIEGTSTVL